MTPAQVLEDLGGSLAYTTVMTTLARLHDKGALVRKRSGRAYAYSLAASADSVGSSLTARRMSRLLDADPNRASALARFVAELTPDDEKVLAELLTDHPHEPGD
jgi:predicted transcriptional regulator